MGQAEQSCGCANHDWLPAVGDFRGEQHRGYSQEATERWLDVSVAHKASDQDHAGEGNGAQFEPGFIVRAEYDGTEAGERNPGQHGW